MILAIGGDISLCDQERFDCSNGVCFVLLGNHEAKDAVHMANDPGMLKSRKRPGMKLAELQRR